MEESKSHFSLSHFLASSTAQSKNVCQTLKEYKFIYTLLENTINAYIARDMDHLDPLVGENACHIRAWYIVGSFQSEELTREMEDLLPKLKVLKEKVDEYEAKFKHLNNIPLEPYDMKISADVYALFMCHALTASRVKVNEDEIFYKEKIDPRRLLPLGSVSRSYLESFLYKCRKLLSDQSVEFVKNHSKDINDTDLLKVISDDFTVKHNDFTTLPLYWTIRVLMHAGKKLKHPILMQALFQNKNKDTEKQTPREILFVPIEGRYVVHVDDAGHFDEKPVICVKGHCLTEEGVKMEEWMKNVEKYGIEQMILAGAAAHRQYVDETKDEMVIKLNDPGYEDAKSFAHEKGFSHENPSFFFISHVYPGIMGKNSVTPKKK